MGNNKVAVIYGSQTGQSKSVAENIASIATDKSVPVDLMSMEESIPVVPWQNYDLLVVVTSSTGDGDPPDNAIKFWRRLRGSDLDRDSLSHLRFALLGLGDTNYSTFCGFPKAVDKKLQDLGARKFVDSGYADDAVGLETVVEPWIDRLFPNVLKALTDPAFCLSCAAPVEVNGSSEPSKTENLVNGDSIPELETIPDTEIVETSEPETSIKNPNLSLQDVDLKIPLCPQPFLKITNNICGDFNVNDIPRQNIQSYPSAASPVVDASIKAFRVLTHPEAVKTSIEITLDLMGTQFDYQPGDSFAVVCPNPYVEVETLLKRLRLLDRADVAVTVDVEEKLVDVKAGGKNKYVVPPHLPRTATLRYWLLHCCEIRSVPKKALLRVMAEHTLLETEKRRLLELCSIQGSEDYVRFIREPNLNVIDLFEHFPSCSLPVERLLEHLPRLLPRPYSFSSSPLVSKDKGTFVFNVVNFPATSGRTYARKGLATGWLQSLVFPKSTTLETDFENLHINEKTVKVPLYLRTGTSFRLPEDTSVPVIMVGPGTGVAPFIGFLQQREQLMKQTPESTFGTSWLFFGCRRRDRDYLYKEEIERLFNAGVLNRLLVSFSREDIPNKPKYVQELIREHQQQLIRLLDRGARIYVCGDAANMSKDVMNAFVAAVANEKNISETEATSFILNMMKEKKYLQDIWT